MKYILSITCICMLYTLPLLGYSDTDKVNTFIDSLCKSLNVVGLKAIAVKDTSVIFDYSYGNILHCIDGEYVTAGFDDHADLWRVASVTKNVIAMAVMQLCDRGKIKIDHDANEYLPKYLRNPQYPDDAITVRMLLSHYSSIAAGQYARKNYGGVVYIADRPGTKYVYSNINYLLLALIIEHVTGERFDRYIQKNLFRSVGIFATFNPFEEKQCNLVYGKWFDKVRDTLFFCNTYHAYNKKKIDHYKLTESTKWLDPAGGLIITSVEMIKYLMFCMGATGFEYESVISEKSRRQMCVLRSSGKKYGLGTLDYSYILPGETLYGHTGYAYGIFSAMIYNPESKYGFLILCNGVEIDYPKALEILHAPIVQKIYNCVIAKTKDDVIIAAN